MSVGNVADLKINLMQIDVNSLLQSLVTLVAGGGGGWLLRSSRRKSDALAAQEELRATDLALAQISQLQQAHADLNSRFLALQNEVAALRLENMELKNKLTIFRCDLVGCPKRVPTHNETVSDESAD